MSLSTGESAENEVKSMLAVEEAANWRLTGLLLQRPHSGWWRETEALSDEVRHPRLKAAVQNIGKVTEGAYLRIFGPGGIVSPREIAYRTREDPGRIMADIAGIYRSFIFQPRNEDPMDHICVEANFAGFLCLKEAYALADGNPEAAGIVSRGLRSFLRDHLESFAHTLSRRLEDVEPRYLSESVRCVLDLVRFRIGE